MLCAKKTIFIIEKNTTILQSMFVINKMTQWMTVGLRGNRVWNEGFCSCIPTPFSHFYPALFFIAFLNPIFCFPSTLVESLIAAKPCKCMMYGRYFELYLSMMEWKEKSGRTEEEERRVFPPLSLLPSPQCFFPAHFSLHLLQYLNA